MTRYADVVLEALALSDAREAREFAQRELGALAAADPRTATLRKTLVAYFQAGGNRAAAAALLAVHERTVGYRLSAIEKLLGHDIGQRRDELGMALRVQRLLDAPVGRRRALAASARGSGVAVARRVGLALLGRHLADGQRAPVDLLLNRLELLLAPLVCALLLRLHCVTLLRGEARRRRGIRLPHARKALP